MSFHRTTSGLSNLHLFLKADCVAYVEGGGENYSTDDILKGNFSAESEDIHFWRALLKACGLSLKLRFRAVGSKPTLLELATLVAKGDVTRVIVAMDRDYDHFYNKKITSPLVIYTYGYSWENDAWSPDVIKELFYSLTGSDLDRETLDREVTEVYKRFRRDIRRAVHADIICNAHNISFLPKSKPLKVVSIEKSGMPIVNKGQIKSCFAAAKAKRAAKLAFNVVSVDPSSDCHGHLFAEFGYLVLKYLAALHAKSVLLPKDVANSWAIDKFAATFGSAPATPAAHHYRLLSEALQRAIS